MEVQGSNKYIVGIYKITSPTGRIYVGQSINIYFRFNEYNKLKCKGQVRLYSSFNKHGVHNHTFEIIEECSVENLNERERHWQEYYNVLSKKGLNCVLTNTSSKSGVHSNDVRTKIGLGNKGKKRSDEVKLKISKSRKGKCSGKDHPLYGKNMNYEWRMKLSKAKSNGKHHLLGKNLSDNWRKNISHALKGRMVDFENKKSCIVLNMETGIYYESISFAAKCHGIKKTTLINKIKGYRRNNTNIILA